MWETILEPDTSELPGDEMLDRQLRLRGRQLADDRAVVLSQYDCQAQQAWWSHNREALQIRGECSPGCHDDNLTETASGQLVCVHTRRPCPRRRLRAILEVWTLATTTMSAPPKRGELVPAATKQQLIAIEELRAQTRQELAEAEANGHDILKGVVLANAMRQLQLMLTDEVMRDAMALMNSPLGFDTDRNPAKGAKETYGIDVVRDCCITALLQGYRIVGNEFNIIAGRFYAAKDGVKRQVQEWPGLTNLEIQFGVPTVKDGGALVPCVAAWRIGGRQHRLECAAPKDGEIDTRIPVRVNSGQGADAILGKAARKMYARIFERLLGIGVGSIETDPDDRHEAATTGALPSPEDDGLAEKVAQATDLQASLLSSVSNNDSISTVVDMGGVASQAVRALKLPPEIEAEAIQGIKQVVDDRVAEIRGGRGERSNRKHDA